MSFASESRPLNFFQDSEVHFVLKKEPNIPWAYYKYDQIFSVFYGPSPVQNPNSKPFRGSLFYALLLPRHLALFLFCCQHLVSPTHDRQAEFSLPLWTPIGQPLCYTAAGELCVLLSV